MTPLQPSADNPSRGVVDGLCERLQQKCSDWGTYWRAPDAHGVNLSMDQALELLRDALGVEVEIVQAAALPADQCQTCNGHGMIGGFVNADSGYQSDQCPDCTALPAVPDVDAIEVEVIQTAAPNMAECRALIRVLRPFDKPWLPTEGRYLLTEITAATPAHDQPEGSGNE